MTPKSVDNIVCQLRGGSERGFCCGLQGVVVMGHVLFFCELKSCFPEQPMFVQHVAGLGRHQRGRVEYLQVMCRGFDKIVVVSGVNIEINGNS